MRYVLLILAVFLMSVGCSSKATFLDRITFDSEMAYKQIDMRGKGFLILEESSKSIVVAKTPSGFVGAFANISFDLGMLFDAHLKQAMYYTSASGEKREFSLEILEFDYTLSATASAVFIREFDYCSMKVKFSEVGRPGVEYVFSAETDIPSKEILASSVKGRAITETVDKIVKQFVRKIADEEK